MKKYIISFLIVLLLITTAFAGQEYFGREHNFINTSGDDVEFYFSGTGNRGKFFWSGSNNAWTFYNNAVFNGTLEVVGGLTFTTPLTVPYGGTGAATFTDGGILLGSGTGAFTALGAASNGQIPIGDGTTDPVLATITGTANEVDITNGAGTITVGLVDPVIVAKGGSGAATFTDGGILLGSGTGAFTVLGAAANGEIPIGDGTTDPQLATITGTANEIIVTNGAASITLSAGAALSSLGGLTETNGGIAYGTADNAYAWLAAGAEGTLLMGNGAGAPSFLAAGAANTILRGAGAADPTWTGIPILTSGTGTGVSSTNAMLKTAVYRVVVLYTQFDAASTNHDLTIATMPEKTFIHSIVADLSTPFVCAAVCTTATLSGTVGISAGGVEFLESFDLDNAIAIFGDADAEVGTTLDIAGNTNSGYLKWGSQIIVLRAVSGTGNWGDGAGATNLNAGGITFYITYSVLDTP